MADRNERHFLEFYTPARERIGRLAARRQAKTERQHQLKATTPFSDDKENPPNDQLRFAAPATIAGEKAQEFGRQRRRLFTRSAGKQTYDDNSPSTNDYGPESKTNAAHTPHDLDSDLAPASLPAFEFASPPLSRSTVSRALFSTNENTTPVTVAIDENAQSPPFSSPPGTSNLLKEYRSKQSLLSSSKTRISSFSSPISGGLRLRPSSLWKKGRGDNKSEEDQNMNPNDSPSKALETKTEVTTTGVEAATPTASSSQEEFPFETNSIVETTPSSANKSTGTPEATPKRSSFWSPPGTSRLLRKYRQRTQQLEHDGSSFQSPPHGALVAQGNFDRSRTTPRGRRGLRLLDSGAKRCRNHRLSLRPLPAANEVTTPAKAKIRASVKTTSKAKDSSTTTAVNNNLSLLSPSTAKRLNKDIKSYRQAHGRANNTDTSADAEKGSPLLEETKLNVAENEDSGSVDPEGNEDYSADDVDGGLEMAPSTQLLPAFASPSNAFEHLINPPGNKGFTDPLPFDEQNATKSVLQSDTPQQNHESSVQVGVTRDTLTATTSSPEVVDANPSDEDATESSVFRSTRSASLARRQSSRDVSKLSSSPVTVTVPNNEEENESGVFRSTRSATRARSKSLHDAAEAPAPADAAPVIAKDAKASGVFRSTRSATRARNKSIQDGAEPADADPNEANGVFRSTRSATRTRSKSVQNELEATANSTTTTPKDESDEVSGVFRSTRSASRARSKSVQNELEATAAATPILSQKGSEESGGVFRSTRSATRARGKSVNNAVEATPAATLVNSKEDPDESSGVFRSTRSATRTRRKSLLDAENAVSAAEAAIAGKSGEDAIENSFVEGAAASGDSNLDSPVLAPPLPPQEGTGTPSSKGSLQSIWDALHCGVGENSISSSSGDRCDTSNIHANIVSRVGDCVNPMATTLMNMWREEEKAAAEHKKEIEALHEANEINTSIAAPLPDTSLDDKEGESLPPTLGGWKTPPPKSFSTDLNLVYGLERVQNLTLARPKALQASRSMNGESLSTGSTATTIPKPLASCSQ